MISLPELIDHIEQSLPIIKEARVHQEVNDVDQYLRKLFLKVPEADNNKRFNRYLTKLESAIFPQSGIPKANHIRRAFNKVAESAATEFKIVKSGYYRTLWSLLGMMCFGIPIGVAFQINNGNVIYLALGILFGIVLGMVIGTRMDNRAEKQGRTIY